MKRGKDDFSFTTLQQEEHQWYIIAGLSSIFGGNPVPLVGSPGAPQFQLHCSKSHRVLARGLCQPPFTSGAEERLHLLLRAGVRVRVPHQNQELRDPVVWDCSCPPISTSSPQPSGNIGPTPRFAAASEKLLVLLPGVYTLSSQQFELLLAIAKFSLFDFA